MLLDFSLLKRKVPYFIALMATGTCSNYLFRGEFLITDLILCFAIVTYAVLRPNTFFFGERSGYYSLSDSLPGYIFMGVITCISLPLANYLGFINMSITNGLVIGILALLLIVIIDISRYD